MHTEAILLTSRNYVMSPRNAADISTAVNCTKCVGVLDKQNCDQLVK